MNKETIKIYLSKIFKNLKSYFKKLFQIILKPEMKILPGQLAFFLVMSVFPIFGLIGFIASIFNISIDSLISFMQNTMPGSLSEILIPFIQGTGLDLKIGISLITGFIIASNGVYSLIITSNQLYGIDNSNYIKRRIKSIFLTILLVLLVIFIIVVLGFGNQIITFITSLKILTSISETIKILFMILKIPFTFLVMLFIIKLIYVVTLDSKVASKHTTKGALFATLGITLTTLLYSYYVANFSKYDIFYGSLTNIVVMMMWLYLISYIIVIGISINTASYNIEKNE